MQKLWSKESIMRDEVIRTVEAYIGAVRRNDSRGLPLHPDVVFEGPLRSYRGIVEFEKGLADFVPLMKGINVMGLTADDETCAAALEIDTIFGQVPFLEYFHVKDGKIMSIRAYYDPRPVLDGLSRQAAS
jgi:hypothetical protein